MSTLTIDRPRPAPAGGLPERLLTDGDLAQLFGVKTATIARWHRTGQIPPPVRVGRTVGWDPRVIEAFLQGGGIAAR
jgi:predicted DNA-binding transcriptional regulator AlpA